MTTGEVDGVEFSRDPRDYRPDPGGHFRARKRKRDFPGGAIRRCIESGTPVLQDNGYIKLTNNYLNWEFHLIIDPNRGFVVSCYPDDDAWYKPHDKR